jgi:hypothetical protein
VILSREILPLKFCMHSSQPHAAACSINITFAEFMTLIIYGDKTILQPIPVAVRSKAWVFGRSLTSTVGSNHTGGMDVCLL